MYKMMSKVTTRGSHVVGLHTVVVDLTSKIYDLENRSRRNKLVIFGFPECRDKNTASLTESVKRNVLGAQLGLQLNAIERSYSLAKPQDGKIVTSYIQAARFWREG